MIRSGGFCHPFRVRWPRTSGDDPAGKAVQAHATALAPHERG